MRWNYLQVGAEPWICLSKKSDVEPTTIHNYIFFSFCTRTACDLHLRLISWQFKEPGWLLHPPPGFQLSPLVIFDPPSFFFISDTYITFSFCLPLSLVSFCMPLLLSSASGTRRSATTARPHPSSWWAPSWIWGTRRKPLRSWRKRSWRQSPTLKAWLWLRR